MSFAASVIGHASLTVHSGRQGRYITLRSADESEIGSVILGPSLHDTGDLRFISRLQNKILIT